MTHLSAIWLSITLAFTANATVQTATGAKQYEIAPEVFLTLHLNDVIVEDCFKDPNHITGFENYVCIFRPECIHSYTLSLNQGNSNHTNCLESFFSAFPEDEWWKGSGGYYRTGHGYIAISKDVEIGDISAASVQARPFGSPAEKLNQNYKLTAEEIDSGTFIFIGFVAK